MAFKYVSCALMLITLSGQSRAGVIGAVTYANAPVVARIANPSVDAVASTHENVVRSFDGTVSQFSKAIDTPYSSVRKEDTRISNNVYSSGIAKTATFSAPAKTVTYASAPSQTIANVYTHSTPVAGKPLYAASNAAINTERHESGTRYHALPYQKDVTVQVPAAIYTHAEPLAAKTVSYVTGPTHALQNYEHTPAVPTAITTYNHGPDASTYSHNAPGISAYGTSQNVRYSPAEKVSHMSFDGFGTHWGF